MQRHRGTKHSVAETRKKVSGVQVSRMQHWGEEGRAEGMNRRRGKEIVMKGPLCSSFHQALPFLCPSIMYELLGKHIYVFYFIITRLLPPGSGHGGPTNGGGELLSYKQGSRRAAWP